MNVPCHIPAPRAVACDSLHLRASAHLWHVSAFLCNREFLGISCYMKKILPRTRSLAKLRHTISETIDLDAGDTYCSAVSDIVQQHVFHLFQAQQMIVSKYGVRDGYLCERVLKHKKCPQSLILRGKASLCFHNAVKVTSYTK